MSYTNYTSDVHYKNIVQSNNTVNNIKKNNMQQNITINLDNNKNKINTLNVPFNMDTFNNTKYNDGYDMTQNINNDNTVHYNGDNSSLALRSVLMNNTSLSKLFFSKENVDRIQKKIKTSVITLSKGKFKMDVDQDEIELNLAMRAVFLDHGKNLENYLVRQVKVLNQHVLDSIMPEIMTNIQQYYGYLKDISQPYTTLARPMNVNNAGTKTLPSMTSRWGF
jgi:hypothetical protein